MQNLSLDLESATLIYYGHQFLRKSNNFDFLGPNLPQRELWGRNFKNLSLDLESASLRSYVHQASDKRDNFELLCPNLLKK